MNFDLSTLPLWALALLALVGVADLVLYVVALVDLYRRPPSQVVTGNKWIWLAIILLVSTIGAILYLAVGRTAAPIDSSAAQAPTRERLNDIADVLYGARKDDGGRAP